MADEDRVADLFTWDWFYQNLGIVGFIAVVLAFATFFVWWNWDKVKNSPGVAFVLTRLNRKALPKADPERFSVAVANLDGDSADHHHKTLILRLIREFDGVQVLDFDRTISVKGPVPEDREREGHETAREYLRESGASILIWGSVLSLGGQTKPDLYLTAVDGDIDKSKQYSVEMGKEFRLPRVFWDDLSDILRLLITTQNAQFEAKQGHHVADHLRPFIERVRTLVQASANRPEWDAYALATASFILGDALLMLGEQTEEKQAVIEAVAAYHEALKERTRERGRLQWADTQNNLGVALLRLGEWANDSERLRKAEAAFRLALEERTRDPRPLRWAGTQINLGSALARLGELEDSTASLDEAVKSFRGALAVLDRENEPLDWGLAQNNLGSALSKLGHWKRDTDLLKQGIAAFRAALETWTRDRVPLDWAMAQYNLGMALLLLDGVGVRKGDTNLLTEAVEVLEQALEERTRKRAAQKWAMTQSALGTALLIFHERNGDRGLLKKAEVALRAALTEISHVKMTIEWAVIQQNLGKTLRILAAEESGTARLEEAVKAYRAALTGFEAAGAEYYVAGARTNLAGAEKMLAERRGGGSQVTGGNR